MSQDNPVTGHPHGGRDETPDSGSLPGERPATEEERRVTPPDADEESDTASRAAQDGPMTSLDRDKLGPSEGVPERVDAPSPADATDADPPGGSAANQRGRDSGR